MMWLLLFISSVSSSEVLYDGSDLKLSGEVVIEHPLGQMHAEEALIEKPDQQSERFDAIHLRKAVRLELKDYGKLLCENADFDFKSLTGCLKASEGEKISYDQITGLKFPFSMKSPIAHLLFEKGHTALPQLKAISASQGVEISYAGSFYVKAAAAHLDKTVLMAFSQDGSPCSLTHDEDFLQARAVSLDLQTEVLKVEQPKGRFRSLGLSPGGELLIECDHLLWNHEKRCLECVNSVEVKESSLGRVNATSGTITYEGSTLTTLDLDGEVLLCKFAESSALDPSLGNRFAKADHLRYSKENDLLTLTAAPHERVLFWDEEKSLKISANEVRISRNPQTHEESIKGLGNVRFHFSPSESAVIAKLFPHFSEGHADSTR